MDHLDHDELILLHYGESATPGSREHLLACEQCRRESELLRRVLDAVDKNDPAAELPESWEEQTWNRLRWKLERKPRRAALWWPAAAAVLVAAFLAGRLMERRTQPAPAPRTASVEPVTNASTRERILLVVVADHIGRSERVLTEVKNAKPGVTPLLASDHDTVEDLVRKNRLYIDAANASGQAQLADLLQQMQPLLLELARAPEQPSAEDIDMLQRRIDKQGAVTKLRLAGEQIRRSL
jgi:hypothetical protein